MEEKVVHTGDDAFPVVRHLVLRGTNLDIGAALARIAAARHGVTARALQDADPARACAQMDYISGHAPILWDRARGVAREMGIELPTCDATGLPYNQLPPGLQGPGCSLVYYPPATTRSGHPCLSRNFDFPKSTAAEMFGIDVPPAVAAPLRPFLADPYLVELHPTDGGYASLATVAFDLLAGTLDGINSEGLMMAVNADEVALREGTVRQPRGTGFHELACMREVLDRCSTAAEARELLAGARFYVAMLPCHYLVADRHGDAFVFERGGDGELYFLPCGELPTVMTNHSLHRFPDRSTFPLPHDVLSAGTTSFDRFERLEEAVRQTQRRHELADMEAACAAASVSSVVRRIPAAARKAIVDSPGLARTLWHVVYDAEERSMRIRFYRGETKSRSGILREEYGRRLDFLLRD